MDATSKAAASTDEKLDLILRRVNEWHLQKQQLDSLLASLQPIAALLSGSQLHTDASAMMHAHWQSSPGERLAPPSPGDRLAPPCPGPGVMRKTDSAGSSVEEQLVMFARSSDALESALSGRNPVEDRRSAASSTTANKHQLLVRPRNTRSLKSQGNNSLVAADKWTRQLWEKQKSGDGHPVSVRKFATVPNVKEMDAAFLVAMEAPIMGSLNNSVNSVDDGLTPGRKVSSRDEGPLPVLPNPPSQIYSAGRHMPPPPPLLPGKLKEDSEEDLSELPPGAADVSATGKMSAAASRPPAMSPSMHQLSKLSQTGILDNFDMEPAEKSILIQDFGCRMASAFPRWLVYAMFLLPLFGHVGTGIAIHRFSPHLHDVHAHTIGYSFYLGAVVVHVLGASLGMHLLRRALRSSGELTMAIEKLYVFIENSEEWAYISRSLRWQYFFAWLFSVASFIVTLEEWKFRTGIIEPPPISEASVIFRILGQLIMTVSFMVASAVIFLVAYVQAHYLHGMDLSLDCWCCAILHERNFHFGVESWNCMQALLKCIGRELSSSFLALQAFGAMGLVYCLISALAVAFETRFSIPSTELLIGDALAAIPLLCFFALNVRVCQQGAALTEKCRMIPAFVNQIPTEDFIDHERQYLVQFVLDSAAGFNVKHFTITQEFFMKNFILLGGLLSGLVAILSRVY